ncbi:MAG: class I SAM-dependent methyltransferase family protein [Candidatus Pacearchaeota archaeon]
MVPKSFDVLGNIAILKFNDNVKLSEKKAVAKEMLEKHKNIETVLEKVTKVKGRLRTFKTEYLAGVKTKIALYKENNCLFKFDVEKTYFSPRLSNERKEVALQVKEGEEVLVMFAGVAPYPIVIAKLAKPKRVVSVEINRVASKFARENVKLNKVDNVEIIQGDVKRIANKFFDRNIKFDRIVMPRPKLKDTFLDAAFLLVKKNSIINYYGFSDKEENVLNEIKSLSDIYKKKIKILLIKKAGEIAPHKYRWRIDFKVLN